MRSLRALRAARAAPAARAVLAGALLSLIAGCYADPAAVLEQHGWNDHQLASQERVVIGIFDTSDWRDYLDASREIGLDFEPWWGRDAHLLAYEVGDSTGYVLVGDGTPIGAWLVDETGRVRPLSQR